MNEPAVKISHSTNYGHKSIAAARCGCFGPCRMHQRVAAEDFIRPIHVIQVGLFLRHTS